MFASGEMRFAAALSRRTLIRRFAFSLFVLVCLWRKFVNKLFLLLLSTVPHFMIVSDHHALCSLSSLKNLTECIGRKTLAFHGVHFLLSRSNQAVIVLMLTVYRVALYSGLTTWLVWWTMHLTSSLFCHLQYKITAWGQLACWYSKSSGGVPAKFDQTRIEAKFQFFVYLTARSGYVILRSKGVDGC